MMAIRAKLVFLLVGITIITANSAANGQDGEKPLTMPMNIYSDSATYMLYLNEEPLITNRAEWQTDSLYKSEYVITMAGQSYNVTLSIKWDVSGAWKSMTMLGPGGLVTVTRKDTLAEIVTIDETVTVRLRPGTVLFENYSPMLMSHALAAYDQAQGGKQTFPLFIIPQIILDASLERLETVPMTAGDRILNLIKYRYGLPGVDVYLYADSTNRVYLGDVPQQGAAYVRAGYEELLHKEVTDTLLSRAEYEVTLDANIDCPMRNGVALKTDIYRPQADGQFPVILVRTPYKKEMYELQGRFFARRGYVYAVQDCRGRFSSPGEWNPFFAEPNDGYDAIEWLAVQPWSNGKVGMIGGSYLGWVQWWAARNRPPHLVTMIPNVAPPDPYFNIPYEYGSFFLFGAIWWADVLEQEATADITGEAMRKIGDKKYAKLLRELPVIDLDKKVLGKENKYWREWIAHPDNDEFWQEVSFDDYLQSLDIPVYHQSGWYDGDGIGSKLNYLGMKKHGHAYQKLVYGPWGHSDKSSRMGPRLNDFGEDAIVDLEKSYVRWLDRWLLGVENGIDKEPLVALFVMQTNKWLYGDEFPLENTEFTNLYLSSGGGANTSNGDGRLNFDTNYPGAEFDTYIYDPADPTPNPGMGLYEEEAEEFEEEVKSREQEIEEALHRIHEVDSSRADILVYETSAAAEPLTFAGPVSAVLYASSSARDTDWFVRLSLVDSTGEVMPLVKGVIRARYRNSFSEPELLTPGEIYEYKVDMWQTGITVRPGEKLRVTVASADFPVYSRNLNTGGHNETETEFVTATQKIYHSAEYPSHIILPVIPNPEFKDAWD